MWVPTLWVRSKRDPSRTNPRNPAVIADLVGDNVGDCAGRGADLFESTAAENIGAMILGAGLYGITQNIDWVFFPLVVGGFGLLASLVGIMTVKLRSEDDEPIRVLNRGYYITAILAAIGFYIITDQLLHAWQFFACGVIGIILSIAIVFITQYYTSGEYRPVREIAQASETGPATNIITGFSMGLETTALTIISIAIALLSAYALGQSAGVSIMGSSISPSNQFIFGIYGTAVATMGMLSTAAFVLAMDTFGPITDNAGGIVEMSNQPDDIRRRTDKLDSVGNTTKALTKGYALGSAALAAFLLFAAYFQEVATKQSASLLSVFVVDIAQPPIFVAALIGAMLVFLFTSLTIRAVGKAAYAMINEVRRQFREKPGILEGKEKPDYALCVDISTKGALKAMILPGMLPVVVPVALGLFYRYFYTGNEAVEAVGAFLMVATIAGILMATVLNNSGGAWDNAKKYVESGHHGGKKSPAHSAAVVGDTVGDPFKDTAGPSLHVLVKLLATITLVFASLFIIVH